MRGSYGDEGCVYRCVSYGVYLWSFRVMGLLSLFLEMAGGDITIVRYFKFEKKILYLGRTRLLNEAYSYLPWRRNLWLNVKVCDLWLSFLMDGLTGMEAICIS